jgi:hypothetical protein
MVLPVQGGRVSRHQFFYVPFSKNIGNDAFFFKKAYKNICFGKMV